MLGYFNSVIMSHARISDRSLVHSGWLIRYIRLLISFTIIFNGGNVALGCALYGANTISTIPRVSFDMLNTPDNVYMSLQPQPNLYNVTIYETQHLPTTLFTVRCYNLMSVTPRSITTRLVTLLSTVDPNNISNFCKHLQPPLLQSMVLGAQDDSYKAYQNTVNLVLFTRCATFWGDANPSKTISILGIGLCVVATTIISLIL
jgi:hypothetical protein